MSGYTKVEEIHEDWVEEVLDVDSLEEVEQQLQAAKTLYEKLRDFVRSQFGDLEKSIGQTTVDELNKGLVQSEKRAEANTIEGYENGRELLRQVNQKLQLARRPPTDTPPGFSQLPVPTEMLQSGRLLSFGAFGEVYDVSTGTGVKLVFKTAKKDGEEELQSELDAFERIGTHDNIVKCYGEVELELPDEFLPNQSKKKTGILLENLEGGGLDKVFKKLDALKKAGQLSHEEYWGTTQHLMRGLFKGLAHLERLGIVHNDLKLNNVMFDPKTGESKLIDLGMVTNVDDPSKLGNEFYAAPEKISAAFSLNGLSNVGEIPATTSQDSFSAGQMLHERVEGKTFEYGKDLPQDRMRAQFQLMRLVPDFIRPNEDGQFEARVVDEQGLEYVGPYVDFLNRLMHPDPSQRLTPGDALEHPFLSDSLLDPEQAKRLLGDKGVDNQGVNTRREAQFMILDEEQFLGKFQGFAEQLSSSRTVLQDAREEQDVEARSLLLVQVDDHVTKALENEEVLETVLIQFRETAGRLSYLVTTENRQEDSEQLEKLNGFVTTAETLLRDTQSQRIICQKFLRESQKVLTVSQDELQQEVARRTRNKVVQEGDQAEAEHTRQLDSAKAVKDYRDAKAWREAILNIQRSTDPGELADALDQLNESRLKEMERIRSDERLTEEDRKELLAQAQQAAQGILAARNPLPPNDPDPQEAYQRALQSAEKGLGPGFAKVLELGAFSRQIAEQKKQFGQEFAEMRRLAEANDFSGAVTVIERLVPLGHGLLKARADYERQAKLNLDLREMLPDAFALYPPGSELTISKRADRGKRHGGLGDNFPAVLNAIKELQKGATEQRIAQLETAANNYLQHHKQKYDNNKKLAKAERDPAEKFRVQTCEEALKNVKRLRAAGGLSLANLGPPPWDESQERRARQMETTLLVRNNGALPLPSDTKGASESFFLANEKNEKQFIFKPMDGEFSPNKDWPAGGGAPREVMLGRISEMLNKSLGLDTGVSPTSLVKLDAPSLDSGGGSVRIGAVQNFVPSVSLFEANLQLVEDENVQGIALLDFVTLQMDRNDGNLLVKGDPDTNPQLVPIDAGFSLPTPKAFQSGQALFGSNQIFTMPGTDKPFTPELLEKIRQLDPDQIVQTMQKTNQEMKRVDSTAGEMINDESIDLAYRSTLFLKAVADKLTVREIGVEAYGKHFHRLLPPVDVKDFDKIILVILADIEEEKRQWKELQNRNYRDELSSLGWPNEGEFPAKDPGRLLEIVKHGIEHPGTLRKIEALYEELGGSTYDELGFDPRKLKCAARHGALLKLKDQRDTDALLSRPELIEEAQRQNVDLDSLGTGMQYRALQDLSEYLELGGDQRLTEADQFDPNMAFKGRLAAIRNLKWQVEFEELGGEEELTRRRQTGLRFPDSTIEFKVRALKQFAELDKLGGTAEVQLRRNSNVYFAADSVVDALSSLKMWVEYDQLGGESEYKRRGGPETQATNDLWNRHKWLEEQLSLE